MATGKVKTKVTSDDVTAFLDTLDGTRRADALALAETMGEVTGEPPRLWGAIVGFGQYHYEYDSGHKGDTCVVGFSPRKAAFSLYLHGAAFPEAEAERQQLLGKLGKHSLGKGCIYVKKLADVDPTVLRQLIELSVKQLRQRYPA